MSEQLLLSLQETGDRLGVHRYTVKRWLREGTFPKTMLVQLGDRAKVRADHLQAWIDAGCPHVSDWQPPETAVVSE